MSGPSARRLRVALVHHTYPSPLDAASAANAVATALRDAGHKPCIVASHVGPTSRDEELGVDVARVRRLPEGRLRERGFTGPLTHVPLVVAQLLRHDYDVAHAFSAPDALAAQLWRSVAGRPVIFTPAEPITRESLSDRRLRVRLVERAVECSDAVIAPHAETRAELWRWLAVSALEIAPSDAALHVEAYRDAAKRPKGVPTAG